MSRETSVYNFKDYREFLVEALGGKNKRTGQRSALAESIGCQTAYLSQVFSGLAGLNLEQAFRVNQFLTHDSQAAEYFLLLVQKDRAGTHELKNYFQIKLDDILKRRSEINSRVIKNKSITQEDQSYYYSHWYIGAIHIAVSISQLQTPAALARHFHLDEVLVREALDFLTGTGLVVFLDGKFTIGPSHVHLPKNSKFIKQLHTNWRLLALQSLDRERDQDLHYSVAYTLSVEDVRKIRQQILDVIEKNMSIVRPSNEEVMYCNTIDFFEVKI